MVETKQEKERNLKQEEKDGEEVRTPKQKEEFSKTDQNDQLLDAFEGREKSIIHTLQDQYEELLRLNRLNFENENTKLKAEMGKHKTDVECIKDSVSIYVNELKNREETIEELQKENKGLKSRLEQKIKDVDSLKQSELKWKMSKNNEMGELIEKHRKDIGDMNEKYREEFKETQKMMTEYREEMKKMQIKVNDHFDEILSLKATLGAYNNTDLDLTSNNTDLKSNKAGHEEKKVLFKGPQNPLSNSYKINNGMTINVSKCIPSSTLQKKHSNIKRQ